MCLCPYLPTSCYKYKFCHYYSTILLSIYMAYSHALCPALLIHSSLLCLPASDALAFRWGVGEWPGDVCPTHAVRHYS